MKLIMALHDSDTSDIKEMAEVFIDVATTNNNTSTNFSEFVHRNNLYESVFQ